MSGKFWLIFVLSLIASLLIGWRVVWPMLPQGQSDNNSNLQLMRVGQAEVRVEVADEMSEIEQGLSGRQSLANNQGMLFVFSSKSQPVFWMKEMNFSLDMVWIAENQAGELVVVDIAQDLPAPKIEEEPATYQPAVGVDMVLEVNGGWVKVNGIEVGDRVVLE